MDRGRHEPVHARFQEPYRMCVVAKFLVPKLQFVVLFKCGYEKKVEADELIEMADQSKAKQCTNKC